jgi:polar amino acid transport system ATP-binding protein
MKLEAHALTKRYGAHAALDGTDFSTGEEARVIALLGPSGGGKSTLLRVLGCLLVPEERRGNGFVFQGYNLFPHLTALQNITLPLREVHGMPAVQAEQRALELLHRLGLEGHENKRPSQLSGGQQQRAAIARALAPKPRLLLLDEPTSALDPVMTGEVLDVIRELAEAGQSIVLATHEISFARQVADWVVFLAAGKVQESSSASQFFTQPQTELAQQYLVGLSKYR